MPSTSSSGPAGEVYREAGDKAKQAMPEGIALDSSSWKIIARNPN
jgi:hypothetical protein